MLAIGIGRDPAQIARLREPTCMGEPATILRQGYLFRVAPDGLAADGKAVAARIDVTGRGVERQSATGALIPLRYTLPDAPPARHPAVAMLSGGTAPPDRDRFARCAANPALGANFVDARSRIDGPLAWDTARKLEQLAPAASGWSPPLRQFKVDRMLAGEPVAALVRDRPIQEFGPGAAATDIMGAARRMMLDPSVDTVRIAAAGEVTVVADGARYAAPAFLPRPTQEWTLHRDGPDATSFEVRHNGHPDALSGFGYCLPGGKWEAAPALTTMRLPAGTALRLSEQPGPQTPEIELPDVQDFGADSAPVRSARLARLSAAPVTSPMVNSVPRDLIEPLLTAGAARDIARLATQNQGASPTLLGAKLQKYLEGYPLDTLTGDQKIKEFPIFSTLSGAEKQVARLEAGTALERLLQDPNVLGVRACLQDGRLTVMDESVFPSRDSYTRPSFDLLIQRMSYMAEDYTITDISDAAPGCLYRRPDGSVDALRDHVGAEVPGGTQISLSPSIAFDLGYVTLPMLDVRGNPVEMPPQSGRVTDNPFYQGLYGSLPAEQAQIYAQMRDNPTLGSAFGAVYDPASGPPVTPALAQELEQLAAVAEGWPGAFAESQVRRLLAGEPASAIARQRSLVLFTHNPFSVTEREYDRSRSAVERSVDRMLRTPSVGTIGIAMGAAQTAVADLARCSLGDAVESPIRDWRIRREPDGTFTVTDTAPIDSIRGRPDGFDYRLPGSRLDATWSHAARGSSVRLPPGTELRLPDAITHWTPNPPGATRLSVRLTLPGALDPGLVQLESQQSAMYAGLQAHPAIGPALRSVPGAHYEVPHLLTADRVEGLMALAAANPAWSPSLLGVKIQLYLGGADLASLSDDRTLREVPQFPGTDRPEPPIAPAVIATTLAAIEDMLQDPAIPAVRVVTNQTHVMVADAREFPAEGLLPSGQNELTITRRGSGYDISDRRSGQWMYQPQGMRGGIPLFSNQLVNIPTGSRLFMSDGERVQTTIPLTLPPHPARPSLGRPERRDS